VSPHQPDALTVRFHPYPPLIVSTRGGIVSVPLSVRFSFSQVCLGVTQRRALWSSDFPLFKAFSHGEQPSSFPLYGTLSLVENYDHYNPRENLKRRKTLPLKGNYKFITVVEIYAC